MKIGLWKRFACMWTRAGPFFRSSEIDGFFHRRKTSERKRFTENFPHRWAHRMQKHHLMLPRYIHNMNIWFRSQQNFCFLLLHAMLNSRWFSRFVEPLTYKSGALLLVQSSRNKQLRAGKYSKSNKFDFCSALHNLIKSFPIKKMFSKSYKTFYS